MWFLLVFYHHNSISIGIIDMIYIIYIIDVVGIIGIIYIVNIVDIIYIIDMHFVLVYYLCLWNDYVEDMGSYVFRSIYKLLVN